MCVLCLFWIGAVKAAPPTRPICYPLVKGVSAPIFPKYYAGDIGNHFYFFCTEPKTGKVVVEGMSCMKGQCKEELVKSLVNGTSKITRANDAWDANVKYRCDEKIEAEDSDRGKLCAERKRIYLSEIAEPTAPSNK